MTYRTLFFDLDDTLYASSNGLWNAIRERMGLYMVERLGLPADQVAEIRRNYFKTYGTTLRGLQLHYQVDADEYLAYVHDLSLRDYLQPAPQLCEMLSGLPQRRWIFTNADYDHARRVLGIMGLDDCFEGIIDIRAMDWACKPEETAYRRALALAGETDPYACVMLDDSPANLSGAHRLGITTVLVGENGSGRGDTPHPQDWPDVDVILPDINHLPFRMPQLWKQKT